MVAIKSEPASAVPSEAPRFVIVFWRPPTSGLSSSGTAETVTAPSCEASAPIPRPMRSSGTKTISGPASGSSAPSSTTVPARSASSPARTTRRGETVGKRRGIPIAAASRVTERGSSRIAGLDRGQAERDGEIERNDEEEPRLHEELEEEHRETAGELPITEHRQPHERLLVVRLAARLPAEEDPDHEEPAEDQPDRGRETGPRRPAGLGLDPAPLGRAKHAEDEQAEAERREHRTDVVQLGALLDRRIGDPARQKQDREHDHDLSCEHPAPREVRRAEAADQRARPRPRSAPAAATSP